MSWQCMERACDVMYLLLAGPCCRLPWTDVQHNGCNEDCSSRCLLPWHCLSTWLATVISTWKYGPTEWSLCGTYLSRPDCSTTQYRLSCWIRCSTTICFWTSASSRWLQQTFLINCVFNLAHVICSTNVIILYYFFVVELLTHPLISGSTGPIFTIFSAYGRYLIVD